MKRAQEDELNSCVGNGRCSLARTGDLGGNCSLSCDPFLACVRSNMENRSSWLIGPHQYNKSLVAAARDQCLLIPEAAGCVSVLPPISESGLSRAEPKRADCLAFECASCAVFIFEKYFTCATLCGANVGEPTAECIDCSYTFQDVYDGIDELREKLWWSYFAGVFGFHLCPKCSYYEAAMLDSDEPMSTNCRRCHYAIEDFLNSNVFACLDAGIASLRCFSVSRKLYNFEQDFFNVLKPGAESLDFTPSGDGSELAEESFA